jgi:hypothetical protein
VESFGQSCVSEGKETREKGGHQMVQSVLDVVISGKHRQCRHRQYDDHKTMDGT